MASCKIKVKVTLEIEGANFGEGYDIAFTHENMRYIGCIKRILLDDGDKVALLLNNVEVRKVGDPPKSATYKDLLYVIVDDISDVSYVVVD